MPSKQTVVVTGASRGIGRTIALRFAREGARVVLVARDRARLEELPAELPDGEFLVQPADVTSPEEMARVSESVLAIWGAPHLVVANAGRLGPIGPLWESDPASWWRDVEVSLRGSFLLVHGFLPPMVEAGRGRVAFFGGGGSTRVFPWVSAYAISKAALLRLAETLDLELEGTGVHAFSVSPGFVRTDMTERFAETEEGRRFIPDLAAVLDRDGATPPEACAELLVRIAKGDLDGLHGRFLHAGLDLSRLEELRGRAAEIARNEERVLTLRGFSL
jgi:NAD(P)-dependent dehydrogenase (short-subunit alcohol dehydrogenase family)